MQTEIDLPFADGDNIALIRAALAYDPITGQFRWKVRQGRQGAGTLAGTIARNGYRYISVNKRSYLAHRLAWAYVHGAFPDCELDHIDRCPLNNSIANLRLATRVENNGNTGVWRTSTSGFRGVSLDKRRGTWSAYIWKRNRKNHLGCFGSPEAAARAYDMAARDYFGDFATLNFGSVA